MPYYSNNEFDTGFVKNENTGEAEAMFTISITLAEYRDLVAKAAKNEAARMSDNYWTLRLENEKLRFELADLRQKLAEAKEASE